MRATARSLSARRRPQRPEHRDWWPRTTDAGEPVGQRQAGGPCWATDDFSSEAAVSPRTRLTCGGELDRDRQLQALTTSVAAREPVERGSNASPHLLRLALDERGCPHRRVEHAIPQLIGIG